MAASGPEYQRATTMAFASVVAGQVGNVFACRSVDASLFRLGVFSNPLLFAGIGFELAIAAALVHLPFLQQVFGFQSLAPEEYVFLLLPGPALVLANELRRLVARRWQLR